MKNNNEHFEILWHEKPKREGGNPKATARKAFNARIKEGYTPKEMLCGILRYRIYCQTKDILNTPYVQQLATFLGTNKGFLEEWTVNTKLTRNVSISDNINDRSWADKYELV